jgi:membrane-associated protease RseP (regulator of RpoE activity)
MSTRYVLAALALGLAAPAGAQERLAAAPCRGGAPLVGDLGYSGLSCNCTHFYDDSVPSRSVWRFRSEPRILGVTPGGPADGRLRRGDLVVAIDGALITSEEGGRRFAQVEPGRPVALTVRREGRDQSVEITPAAECPGETPTPRAAGASTPFGMATPLPDRPAPATPLPPGRAPVATPLPTPVRTPQPKVPAVPPAPKFASRASLGFSLRCSQCGWSETGGTLTWEFSEPPFIERVEPEGPAARAGLEDGDRITHIDALEITTREAGTRFGAIEPGEQVALRVVRDGERRDVTVTAGGPAIKSRGPLAAAAPRAQPTPPPDVERFTGSIGDALVQVSGGPVSVTQTDDEIVIRSADVTVRIRRTAPGRF